MRGILVTDWPPLISVPSAPIFPSLYIRWVPWDANTLNMLGLHATTICIPSLLNSEDTVESCLNPWTPSA